MLKMYYLILWFFVGSLLMSCSNQTVNNPKTVTLTAADNGQTLTLKPDQQIILVLAANPTTGYHWSIKQLPNFLEEATPAVYTANNINPSLLGGSGQTTWQFNITNTGNDKLELIYQRPWEKDTEPANTFTCYFHISR